MQNRLLTRLAELTNSETQLRDDAFIKVMRFTPRRVRPNHITVVRLVISLALFFPTLTSPAVALAVVAIGAVGDAADGVIARKRDQETGFGKFIDPIADKILALGVLYYLYAAGVVPPILILHIVLPDLMYLLYVAWYWFEDKVRMPAPSIVGRVKVACYFIGFLLMLIAHAAQRPGLHEHGVTLVVIGIVLAWLAHLVYIYEELQSRVAERE